jgi:hypothetical protein
VQRWKWHQGGAPAPVLVRLYERGTYYLADGAFRYRRGAGGRQPLTPERVAPGSGFRPVVGGVEIRVRVTAQPGSVSDEFVWVVRGITPPPPSGGGP